MNDAEERGLQELLSYQAYDRRDLEHVLRAALERAYEHGLGVGCCKGQEIGHGDGWEQAWQYAIETMPDPTEEQLAFFRDQIADGNPTEDYVLRNNDPDELPEIDPLERLLIGTDGRRKT